MTEQQLDYPESRYPYGSSARFHMHHAHLFASDVDKTIEFYKTWFDAEVAWDGGYAGSRNVFLKIGIGAIHLYDQPPKDTGRGSVHHLGFQVVGLEDLHRRMTEAGLDMGPNPNIREANGSKYFMFMAPDNVLLELFEIGPERDQAAREYYGMPD